MAKTRKYIVPALLSFAVVGLGQIIKNDEKKGILYLLNFYFSIPLFLYTILLFCRGETFLVTLAISIIIAISFWIYNIVDAYKK